MTNLIGGESSSASQPAETTTAAAATTSKDEVAPGAGGRDGGNVVEGTRVDFNKCTVKRTDSVEVLPIDQLKPEDQPALVGAIMADSIDKQRIF